jgi:hypothetical protein
MAAWRQRMGSEAAKAVYKQRAATAECVNAQCRNRGLLRFLARAWFKTCQFQVTPEVDRALMVKGFLVFGVTLI